MKKIVFAATGLAMVAAPMAAAMGTADAATSITAVTSSSSSVAMMTTSVYQSDSTTTGRTLLTTSLSENVGASKYGFTTNRGVSFMASPRGGNGLVPIHRLYNPNSTDFIWVAEGSELKSAVSKYGYRDQGINFYASRSQASGTIPVYRLQKGGTHMYTTSATEKNTKLSQGWGEGVASFFVAPAAKPTNTTPTPAPTKPAAIMATPYLNTGTGAYWASKRATDPNLKSIYWQVGGTPATTWFDGTWSGDDTRMANLVNNAKAEGKVPQIAIYGIPYRDCGLYSAGGQKSAANYKAWIDRASSIVGNNKAVIIVEPDAINYCGWAANDPKRIERGQLLTYVGQKFKANNPNAVLYIHAGSAQLSQSGAAEAVKAAGIANMRGFAMNVASDGGTDREEAWAEQFVQTLSNMGIKDKHYVVDTARNGIDSPPNPAARYSSCNNFNAAIGTRPTTNTTGAHADAYLWIRTAGNSDGECGKGDPPVSYFYDTLVQAQVNNAYRVGSITKLPTPAQ